MSRLIGSDGGAFTLSIADADATAWTAGNWYVLHDTAVGGPFSIAGRGGGGSYSGDLKKGDLVYVRANVAVPATNPDKLRLVTFSRIESISSWSFNLQRPEIDLTTLEDEDRVYRFGRSEWQGEVAGVFDRDVTQLYSRVVRSIEFKSATPGTGVNEDEVTALASSEFPFVGVLDIGDVDGLTMVYVEQVSLGGYGFGATDGQRQEFTAPIRRSDGPYSLSPTMYHVSGTKIPGA